MNQFEALRPTTADPKSLLQGEAPEVAAEQPILWLGVSGFSPQQRTRLDPALARPAGLPRWRICAFGDADAWVVNGEKVSVLANGNLKVSAGLPKEHAIRLNLSEVDRPIAFGTPLSCTEFEPLCTFDPDSVSSIHATLLQFERWLWLVRARFVLGARILQQGAKLRHGVFHVISNGRLAAVLDFRSGRAGLSPNVHPVDLAQAQWHKRPASASDFPAGFLSISPAQFAWTYVRRTERDLLPPRYSSELIYFRHAPKVPLRWLSDSQLMLLRELSAEPSTFESLRQQTSIPSSQLRRDLTCLYHAGSITTTRAKAAAPVARRRDSQPYSSGPELESLLSKEQVVFNDDLTAPALLEHKLK